MSSPYQERTATQVKNDLIEHLVSGIVTVHDEKHRNSTTDKEYVGDAPPSTYLLQCGIPDITDGTLVAVERVYGVKDESHREFVYGVDFTIDTTTNNLIFDTANSLEPDVDSEFYVTYKYNQQYTSGITNVGRGTVSEMLISSIAQRFGEVYAALTASRLDSFIDTAQGDGLVQLVKLIDLEKKDASKSSGYITVFRTSPSGNLIVSVGTVFSTDATDNIDLILFEVIQQGEFLDGFTSTRVLVQSKTGYEGAKGNVAPNRIHNVETSGVGIVGVTNPANYVDYEFKDLVAGRYVYELSNLPERIINSQAFPPAITDNGLYMVTYWGDKSIDDSGSGGVWIIDLGTAGAMTVDQDDPETGITKVDVTDLGSGNKPYISLSGLNIPRVSNGGGDNPQGYDQVIIHIRGTAGIQFQIELLDLQATPNSSNPSLYELGVATPAAIQTLNTELTIYVGAHGLASITLANGATSAVPTSNFVSAGQTFSTKGVVAGDKLVITTAGVAKGTYNIDDVVSETVLTISPEPQAASSLTYEVSKNIDEIRIEFQHVGEYYIDFVSIGTFLQEVSPASLDTPDELSTSYTSGKMSVNQSTGVDDFFDTYDGDSVDGHTDELLIYYQWRNLFAGGEDDETDDELRERAKITITSLGKGTKPSIQKAVLDIDGVNQCIVLDFDDDPSILPGDIDIIVLTEGFKVSPSLQTEIIDAVEANRAAGIRANVFLPEVRYFNFDIDLIYDHTDDRYSGTQGQAALEAICSTAIDDYFRTEVVVNKNVFYSNLIGFIIQEVEAIVSGSVQYTVSVEPTFVDDDFTGTYVFGSGVVYDNRISGKKTGVSIVVQRGNGVVITLITDEGL